MLPLLLLSYTGLAFAANYSSSFTKFVPFHLPLLHYLFPAFPLPRLQVPWFKNPYRYGSTDGQSPNCNTATAACGFYSYPGYNAAVSQNLYGKGPGAGAGPQCGKCWRLVPEKDGNGNPIFGAHTIVIKVNNLCPAQGNPLCSQSSLTSQNYLGANVNFDLCIDDGAAAQFFGSSGWGLAAGLAIEVDCSQWSGSPNKYSRRRLQAS